MKLVLSDEADADLFSIARYGLREWGQAQARKYGDGLVSLMRLAAARPSIGRPMQKVPKRFLKVSFKSHHIYYRVDADTVTIVRILHQSMDAPRHLPF